jgi:4-hydroxyphenylpyruvate dioxygenase
MVSPCGKIRIPINEPTDRKSQIEEYLEAYRGEGIQHIALAARNIYGTVETLRARGVKFMSTPDTYYQFIGARLPGHGEDEERLKRNAILIDGSPGSLLIFFEVIQRKGDEGFGEGNFQALFEAIERDQMARGVV